MPTDDEIRLQFQYIGAEKAEELRKTHAQLKDEVGELAAAFGRGEVSAAEFDAEMKRMTVSAKNLDKALDDIDGSTGKAGKGMAGFGQSALQTGRVVQDFAQGGIPGILNNIEGLTQALGMGPGLAGVFTMVGVAAWLAGPKIKEFFADLSEGKNVLPDVEGQLKNVNKQLDDYREKQSLTNDELAHYNELSATQVELEKKKNAEKKSAAELRKLLERGEPTEEAAAAERARTLAESSIGGDTEALIESVRSGLPAPEIGRLQDQATGLEEQLASFDPFASAVNFERAKQLKAQLAAVQNTQQEAVTRLQKEAEGLVNAAMGRGEIGAFRAIQEQMKDRPGAFTPEQIRGFAQAAPEAMQADEDFDRQIKRRQELIKKRNETAKLAFDMAKQEADVMVAILGDREQQLNREERLNQQDEALGREAQAIKNRRGAEEAQSLQREASANIAGIDAEVGKIQRTLGQQRQVEYEGRIAGAAAAGASPRQQAALARQLQEQMARGFEFRGAAPQAANLAAAGIAQKGQEDIQKRVAHAQGMGLNAIAGTQMIVQDLISEYQKLTGMAGMLQANNRQMNQRVGAIKRGAMKIR